MANFLSNYEIAWGRENVGSLTILFNKRSTLFPFAQFFFLEIKTISVVSPKCLKICTMVGFNFVKFPETKQ
jgi:hypothetical protein